MSALVTGIPDCSIEGPKLIKTATFEDKRGQFTERFRENEFSSLGLGHFVQDNFSVSKPGVLRGLHYQFPFQSKLLTVLSGEILDVIVDLRAHSKTFGQWTSYKMKHQTNEWLWIPEGFAHGFASTGCTDAHVWYKCSTYYNPRGESGIRWNDPTLNIVWPLVNPIISQKDQDLPLLHQLVSKHLQPGPRKLTIGE